MDRCQCNLLRPITPTDVSIYPRFDSFASSIFIPVSILQSRISTKRNRAFFLRRSRRFVLPETNFTCCSVIPFTLCLIYNSYGEGKLQFYAEKKKKLPKHTADLRFVTFVSRSSIHVENNENKYVKFKNLKTNSNETIE